MIRFDKQFIDEDFIIRPPCFTPGKQRAQEHAEKSKFLFMGHGFSQINTDLRLKLS
jgi:hypothetical protein